MKEIKDNILKEFLGHLMSCNIAKGLWKYQDMTQIKIEQLKQQTIRIS